MSYTDNPIADFDDYSYRQEKWLKSRPECAWCGQPIQDESAYYVNNDWCCERCMEEMRRWIDE